MLSERCKIQVIQTHLKCRNRERPTSQLRGLHLAGAAVMVVRRPFPSHGQDSDVPGEEGGQRLAKAPRGGDGVLWWYFFSLLFTSVWLCLLNCYAFFCVYVVLRSLMHTHRAKGRPQPAYRTEELPNSCIPLIPCPHCGPCQGLPHPPPLLPSPWPTPSLPELPATGVPASVWGGGLFPLISSHFPGKFFHPWRWKPFRTPLCTTELPGLSLLGPSSTCHDPPTRAAAERPQGGTRKKAVFY